MCMHRRNLGGINMKSIEQGNVTFVAYITLKNGKKIYASQFGKKAFPIVSRKPKKDN